MRAVTDADEDDDDDNAGHHSKTTRMTYRQRCTVTYTEGLLSNFRKFSFNKTLHQHTARSQGSVHTISNLSKQQLQQVESNRQRVSFDMWPVWTGLNMIAVRVLRQLADSYVVSRVRRQLRICSGKSDTYMQAWAWLSTVSRPGHRN